MLWRGLFVFLEAESYDVFAVGRYRPSERLNLVAYSGLPTRRPGSPARIRWQPTGAAPIWRWDSAVSTLSVNASESMVISGGGKAVTSAQVTLPDGDYDAADRLN